MSREREKLWVCLTSFSERSWAEVKPLICAWWDDYKFREAGDRFHDVFLNKRMSVRTFGAKFDDQLVKSIGLGDRMNLGTGESNNRFFKDSQYSPIPIRGGGRRAADDAFDLEATNARKKFVPQAGGGSVRAAGAYWANRALDSAAFSDPGNFVCREAKYDAGLHDLSASLMNPNLSIFDQIHNTEQGAHFSFMPLPDPGDQRMIYTLIRMAKIMRPYWPEMYQLMRDYRTKMTRVKLASEFDMGVGYIVIPVTNPGPTDRKFRLRYGLVNNMTVPKNVNESGSIKVTPEVYQGRQQAARDYQSIIKREGKNEIVIALRQHAGDFPIYARREGDVLKCYKIVRGSQVDDGRIISKSGVMT